MRFTPQCYNCRHYDSLIGCPGFPDGIPDDIALDARYTKAQAHTHRCHYSPIDPTPNPTTAHKIV
ncbi:MAG: hypothetical protein ACXV7G_11840 [Halobacteriota archaeon]